MIVRVYLKMEKKMEENLKISVSDSRSSAVVDDVLCYIRS